MKKTFTRHFDVVSTWLHFVMYIMLQLCLFWHNSIFIHLKKKFKQRLISLAIIKKEKYFLLFLVEQQKAYG